MTTEMAPIVLPRNIGCHEIVSIISDNQAFNSNWEKLILVVPPNGHISTCAMTFLCAWGLELRRFDRKLFVYSGDNNAANYLSRMNLFRHLEIPYEETFSRHTAKGRFIPLCLVADIHDVKPTVDAIVDLVIHQFENARAFIPALEWAVNEIVDNIIIHSETKAPGAVCAQYYPKKHQLHIGICDMGRGIKDALSTSYSPADHEEAIKLALQRGITRDKEVGQGNGLAGSDTILKANKGDFKLWSGNTMYHSPMGRKAHFKKWSVTPPGTGANLIMDTRKPVDLSKTFIGESAWSYIDAECERIATEGGLKIVEECVNTGTREPAKALRQKIVNLLPDFEGQFVIDFFDVRSASSSFLDELLGRLALHIGANEFRRKIAISNATKTILDQANVVIHQRLTT